MTRFTRALFLLAALAWLTSGQTDLLSATQCTGQGALIQDNFDGYAQGWYCNENEWDSEYICSAQGFLCGEACRQCGTEMYAAPPCEYYRDTPWPGYPGGWAQRLGCTQNIPYPNKFVMPCNCYLPSCQINGSFCMSGGECCSNNCNESTMQCQDSSPVLIDTGRNARNLDLTSAENGVAFDIDASGDLEQIAWTEPSSDVGLLTLDLNGNGTVDNGAELFGTATRLSDGSLAPNGFDALAELDGNGDHTVDARDPAYTSLRVWLDDNHNGLSETEELAELTTLGIVALSTDYRDNRRVDRNGNRYAYVGSATVLKNGREHRRVIFDVVFAVRP